IRFDADLECTHEGFRRVEDGGRLIPLTVEAVMDELMIPAKLGRPSSSARSARGGIGRLART
ncbi:MAG TPA: hypothetical protein VIS99_01520, partial [Terrimicrobiaceae bacterium]